MVRDPISEFIIAIKNAGAAGHPTVSVPYSKMKQAIADVLAKEGFVGEVDKRGKKVRKTLEVTLKYEGKKPFVRGVKRVSKLSKRVYLPADKIHPVKFGHGLLILTTPKGILTDKEARKEHIGGEPLFSIW